MHAKRISRLPLYRSRNYYGICIWESIFAQRMAKRENQSLIINRILGLKRNGKYGDFFKTVIKAASDHFGARSLAVIPGSKKGPSHLQILTGNRVFERTKEVRERRKYNHGEIPPEYGRSIKLNGHGLHGKILLVDDIITTGATMDYFKGLLHRRKVITFAFAINWKLDPKPVGELLLPEAEHPTYSALELIGMELEDIELPDVDFSEYL